MTRMTSGNRLKTTQTAVDRALACSRSRQCFRRRSRIEVGYALSLPRTTSCIPTLRTSVRNATISYGSSSGAKGPRFQFGSFPKSEWAICTLFHTSRNLPLQPLFLFLRQWPDSFGYHLTGRYSMAGWRSNLSISLARDHHNRLFRRRFLSFPPSSRRPKSGSKYQARYFQRSARTSSPSSVM